jgi:hypothetical protein
MLAGNNRRVEPFQRGQDRIDVFTNPFRRGRVVAPWPKLARVIDEGGGQDGAHALGVGAKGQADAIGDDNGALAFGCHSSSMSRGGQPTVGLKSATHNAQADALAEAGIDKNLAHRARAAARMDGEQNDAMNRRGAERWHEDYQSRP